MLDQAKELLKRLIATPSTSRQESGTADILQAWLTEHGIPAHCVYNNVWAVSTGYDPQKPTLLLCSHHDTVKPSASYTIDPYTPTEREGRIYGLGSNDAGASVVSLCSVFASLYGKSLPYNIILGLSAEEEVSGEHGTRALLPALAEEGYSIDAAIVGEPTCMQPAIAERGLMVLDCTAHGVSGHAARTEGVNALYKAIDDINLLRSFTFDKVSSVLGPIKMTVTQIEAGQQHNVVPDKCRYVVDVRTTDAYTNQQTEAIISGLLESEVHARSYRIQASVISEDHPLVQCAVSLGGTPYVSPTTSDMALMHDFPSLKIGPGDSARSHTANEYIRVDEIAQGIDTYTKILTQLQL